MTRASRSRQLRRFNTTLAPQVVDAMQVIIKEYRPGEPLTKHSAQGILNDAVLLWAEMVKQKKQEPLPEVTDDSSAAGSSEQATPGDPGPEVRVSETAGGEPDAEPGSPVPETAGAGAVNEANAGGAE